ncbi:LOW QUALITY PROTEIN: hypothetical protein OSB04_020170 [Centaurea solstitialis]|uniref:Integrase catalytic domain-containing protein n=1 Tax=Centaurea solstitialis TaxID=347529 RepID=A0AA38W3L7_9ASTR|nr:LOW QUALITY PROTEIN: hypothetical protein OSB04_020170 [Centaurea solstitialis]
MKLVLRNVKHVPDMRLNVIFASLLDDGYNNNFGDGIWKLTRGSLIVAIGKKNPKLYMTHPKISNNIVNAVENIDMTDVDLAIRDLATSVSRTEFRSKVILLLEKKNILNLVYFDVCGPMKTRTLGGCSYFVTFIDDHSRKYLMCLNNFMPRLREKLGRSSSTDNGGEYNGPFDAYCREHGIRHQKSPPKTPQLNGLVERMNRTLVERVRCLLSHAWLLQSFWGGALNTAICY